MGGKVLVATSDADADLFYHATVMEMSDATITVQFGRSSDVGTLSALVMGFVHAEARTDGAVYPECYQADQLRDKNVKAVTSWTIS